MLTAKRQIAESAFFQRNQRINVEFYRSGNATPPKPLAKAQVEKVKQLLRIDQRNWNPSYVSYANDIRLICGNSTINITAKKLVINCSDSEGHFSQYETQFDAIDHDELMKILGP